MVIVLTCILYNKKKEQRGMVLLSWMLSIVKHHCGSLIGCHIADGDMAPVSCMKIGEGRNMERRAFLEISP